MDYQISVIIPTYNSWKTLRDCLGSISKQTLNPNEIVVIDNASTDGTAEKVSNLKHQILNLEIFKNKKNLGVTGGRNRGIKEAPKSSDYLFFFDHDMIADKKMLEELVKVAKMDPKIGIVTPKIYYWEDKKRIWSAGTGINLWTGQVLFRGGKDVSQYEEVEEVQVAPAAMLVKREAIGKIKGFDNKYFATYEDTDFCFRARRAGFKTYYSPKAVAYHKLSTDPRYEADRLLSRAYYVGKNRVLFMKDFGKNFYIFLFFLPVYIIYYLKLAIKYYRLKDWFTFLRGTFDGLAY